MTVLMSSLLSRLTKFSQAARRDTHQRGTEWRNVPMQERSAGADRSVHSLCEGMIMLCSDAVPLGKARWRWSAQGLERSKSPRMSGSSEHMHSVDVDKFIRKLDENIEADARRGYGRKE